TGNNESLEDRTYGDLKEEPAFVTGVRRGLQNLRTYGLIRQAIEPLRSGTGTNEGGKFAMAGDVSAILDQSAGIDRYHRDAVQTDRILNHFRLNLHRMVDIAGASGAAIMFIVPASNERDFSPFKSSFKQSLSPEDANRWRSLNDRGMKLLEAREFGAAREIFELLKSETPEYADVRYRLGLVLFSLGDYEGAKNEFIAARDNDVAPLRATSAIQEIVREVAAERNLPLFDFQVYLETDLAEKAGHTCLGNEFFYDHCHPTIEAHQLIAEQVRRVAAGIPGTPAQFGPPSISDSALYAGILASLGPEYYGVRDLNIAKVLRWAGKNKEAELFVRKAARELSDHPEAWYLLGLTYQEKGELDSASEALTRSIELDPSNAQAFNTLGSVSLRRGDTDRAIHMYREAIQRNPDLRGVHYNLGNALVGQGNAEAAMQAYRQELAIDPRNTMALNNLGFLHLNRQEFDMAKSLFEETIALDPQNIEAYSNLGIVAVAAGDPVTALEMFRQVLSISPGDQFATEWIQRLNQSAGEGGGGI
ncbi:MAG: tetratricopeptide repeat protein, partial [Ignavibacteria bacterium]|nr:tetratricopeptide repeat protein [Ignavibacteria bacterium]